MSVLDTKKTKVLSLPGRNIKFIVTPQNSEIKEMVMCLTEIPRGGSLPVHEHSASAEVMYLTSGTGEAEIAGEIFPVSEESAICVPKGVKHTVRNTGEKNLNMVCAFSPAIDTKPYEEQSK